MILDPNELYALRLGIVSISPDEIRTRINELPGMRRTAVEWISCGSEFPPILIGGNWGKEEGGHLLPKKHEIGATAKCVTPMCSLLRLEDGIIKILLFPHSERCSIDGRAGSPRRRGQRAAHHLLEQIERVTHHLEQVHTFRSNLALRRHSLLADSLSGSRSLERLFWCRA